MNPMLLLGFGGWMQCRLATDPDPFDETRGITGYTRALPEEPNLDRIIRLQPEQAVPRRFGPQIGVTVTSVRLGARRYGSHALLGAAVDLLDSPVYEGRNGLAFSERNEPILPFHLVVRGEAVTLRHAHTASTGLPAQAVRDASDRLLVEAGIGDPATYMTERRLNLEGALRVASTDLERETLQQRLAGIAIWKVMPQVAARAMHLVMTHSGTLEGDDWEIADPDNKLGVNVQRGWSVEMNTGAYDPDTMCGWVSGEVTIPTA